MEMRVHFACGNSEVSFFCLPKLLPLNSIFWFVMIFHLTPMMISVWFAADMQPEFWIKFRNSTKLTQFMHIMVGMCHTKKSFHFYPALHLKKRRRSIHHLCGALTFTFAGKLSNHFLSILTLIELCEMCVRSFLMRCHLVRNADSIENHVGFIGFDRSSLLRARYIPCVFNNTFISAFDEFNCIWWLC